ncbi:GGDEF domain-containing protein [Pseudomonas sp. 5P_3.1_Bac2]|uniref:GGDEF domain-containing protein n=1 Tax=Pseudomonas sp. 5P_3.1_Bac2 TaxID=2971617 RepID=UPI0021C9EB36|nr:GGDEF domain-containing protein [Pseudomonas sp. 5P_3.1_Bac2]MCU1716523.1 GGDEF domain-containing protein [Pseudomonas sp. 5P_3.1_Bac2]
MVTRPPSNTIDFDAAKLQRLGYARELHKTLQPISLAQLRQQLNMRLQTSLEVERIVEMFFHEVQRLVPLGAVSYQLHACDLHLEFGQRASHSAGYRLNHDGDFLGELTLRRNQRFTDEELGQLESLLASMLFPLRNALLYRAALQTALRDPLTQTGNRIAMQQSLKREVELARRNMQPMSVLMVDIDHFKQINDQYGHLIGDQALIAVANALKDSLRNVDMVFRFGGEEFMVLLSNTDPIGAAMVGERVRLAVQNIQHLVHNQPLPLSVSLGCATLQGAESMDSLLERADQAMYESKRGGRNRLSMAG